jgi:hypothetical protein
MKKSITLGYLILIILSSNVNIVFGQSFVNLANRWYISGSGDFTGAGGGTSAYFFETADSLVTEKGIYYQLYTTEDSTFREINPTESWFRQEGSKIYKYSGEQEELYYDFNLAFGDSITYFTNTDYQFSFVVTAIDSVTLNNGTKRKQLTLNEAEFPESSPAIWIKGIGSIYNTFLPYADFFSDGGSSLQCYFEKDTLLFPLEYALCKLEPFTATNNLLPLEGVQIYPSTNYDVVQLEVQNNGEYLCQVFDMNGKEVHRQFITRGLTTFSLEHTASGLYIIQVLELEKQQIFVAKVVKK